MSELAAVLARRRAQESGAIWATEIPFESLGGSQRAAGTRVFLGSGRDASNLAKLQENGVKRVLNVADDVPNYHEGHNITYCRLEVADFGAEALRGDGGIARNFQKAKDFILSSDFRGGEHHRDCGGKQDNESDNVLIHCANGSNRSVTVTIAMIMMLDRCDLRTAWNTVKGRRSNAMPLKDNRSVLLDFEKKLLGENSMTEEGFFKITKGADSSRSVEKTNSIDSVESDNVEKAEKD